MTIYLVLLRPSDPASEPVSTTGPANIQRCSARGVLSAPGVHLQVGVFLKAFELNKYTAMAELMALLRPTIPALCPCSHDDRFGFLLRSAAAQWCPQVGALVAVQT